jgi:hypothetical protein
LTELTILLKRVISVLEQKVFKKELRQVAKEGKRSNGALFAKNLNLHE